ncbi:RsbR, positive regulator of sigma-B [Domibacillus indicus]|uniref:STAS domain-containing protein n=1 Tax=Domibacillus indicus TaxID=1437523 RepID=UPI00203F4DCF|nr:STAS domain-containing protein [Domibacillus indicus]MCM3790553.1 RsbR, positive regulator of sigma-B [Domibacillus indicus]
MSIYGKIPENISPLHALDSIGETIILADKDYNVVWMNAQAHQVLSTVAPLFGLTSSRDMIGLNMSRFHRKPEQQKKFMDELSGSHRARITIRDQFVADIVITPIQKGSQPVEGFVVMLMDVTTKAEEEKEKEKLIKALSTPILKIWSNAIALPLIGEFNVNRFDLLISSILEECSANQIEFVLLNLSDLYTFDNDVEYQMQKLIDCVNLIGAQCILVGIPPALARLMTNLNRNILIFSTTYEGLKYIIEADNEQ